MVLVWLLLQSRPVKAFRALSNRDKSLVLAVAVGGAVRLLWAIVVTSEPVPLSDAAEYLRIARDLTEGALPTFDNGHPSAWFAPGYPLLLAPLVIFDRATALIGTAMLASLLNACAGTFTVWATAWSAERWLSPAARNPAGWLMALAPAHVFFVSTAHAETVFTALVLSVFIVVTKLVDRDRDRRRPRPWLLLGLLLGLILLTRSQGVVLLAVPLLCLRARRGTWRGLGRAYGLLVAGALVLLVPWTIRNGVQVGVWTPTSTSNAVSVCLGHHDDTTIEYTVDGQSRQILRDCYRYSPYDDPELGVAPPWWEYRGPDEARWYREANRRGIEWALGHPVAEVGRSAEKLLEMWRDDSDALPAATNFTSEREALPYRAGNWAANAWLWLVEALAVGGLVLVRRCREALPVWAMAGLFTLTVVAGLSIPHYRHPAVPFVVMLAAGAVAALRGRSADRALHLQLDQA